MFSNVSDLLVSLTRSLSEYQLRFKERTTTDYAILEDSIVYDLDAATVCFFAKDTDSNKPPNEYQCVYSYAVSDQNNELLFCTSPVLRVLVDGVGRYLTCIEAMLSVSLVLYYQNSFKWIQLFE